MPWLYSHHLQAVDNVCHLDDTVSATGGATTSVSFSCRTAWSKFRNLLPLHTSRSISMCTRSRIYKCCVRSPMQYASECRALRNEELAHLARNERAMLRWICRIKSEEKVATSSLYKCLDISIWTPPLDTTTTVDWTRPQKPDIDWQVLFSPG